MRLKIVLTNSKEEKIVLPIHYNHLLQAFIYNNIDKDLANFLHNEGYKYQKRNFKMFVFSRIFSNEMRLHKEEIIFDKEIYFFLSSPIKEFLSQFAEKLLKNYEFKIYKSNLNLKSIEVLNLPLFKEKERIKMLSPLTVYSTLYKEGEKKKTYYYSPFEKEFKVLIRENLRKKYISFYKKDLKFDFEIEPLKVNKKCEEIIIYKNTVIKGWLGIYEIRGTPEIIRFAYDVGLGSKNSQGFGMFELCT